MTTDLRAPLTGFRFAETRRGDSLQAISARELGDGKRWPELISYNRLTPPYITDDPAQARAGVIVTGALILVPASTAAAYTTDDALIFERDIRLDGGEVAISDGDFAGVEGLGNLRQAIRHRVVTDRGELIMHPEYGSKLRLLIGAGNNAIAGQLAAEYARAAVASDPRVQSVRSSSATVSGDSIAVSVVAEPITGKAVDVTITI